MEVDISVILTFLVCYFFVIISMFEYLCSKVIIMDVYTVVNLYFVYMGFFLGKEILENKIICYYRIKMFRKIELFLNEFFKNF